MTTATINHPFFPAGTTVTGTTPPSSFTVNNNASVPGAPTTATLAVSSITSDLRHFGVTGTITSGNATIPTSDTSKLAVGYLVQHPALPTGTRIASIVPSTSFTVTNNAMTSASSAVIDVAAINNLNQIIRNDTITPDGVTTTYTYSYDANGNTKQKQQGTNIWSYTWNEDNRLTRVTFPSGDYIEYNYDAAGRMLWRKKHSDTNASTFEWDGMDIVRETDTAGVVTRLYVVNGVLMSFERSNVTYQIHSDALGHVRRITDSGGSIVFSANYDAWGNLLAVSDSVPGGWMYRYMGRWGCRFDPDTGLVYCRQRWLDTTQQRFVSRDFIVSINRYAYGANNPMRFIDDNGLQVRDTDLEAKAEHAAEHPQSLSPFQRGVFDAVAGLFIGVTAAAGAVSIGIPVAVVGTVGAVAGGVGTILSGVNIVEGLTHRDLAGYPISDDDASYRLGSGVVGAIASALTFTGSRGNQGGEAMSGAPSPGVPLTQAELDQIGPGYTWEEMLYRRGSSWERTKELRNAAASAEGSRIGIYGVSVSKVRPNVPYSAAKRRIVEEHFPVHSKPSTKDPTHCTVELPKPVSPNAAWTFNKIFGRKR